MKKLRKLTEGTVLSLCSLALAFSLFLPAIGNSVLFFGEPEYPTED